MKTVTNILLIISYLCSFPLQMLTNAWRKNIPVQPTQNVSTLFLRILVHAFLDIKCMQSFAKVGDVWFLFFSRFYQVYCTELLLIFIHR